MQGQERPTSALPEDEFMEQVLLVDYGRNPSGSATATRMVTVLSVSQNSHQAH